MAEASENPEQYTSTDTEDIEPEKSFISCLWEEINSTPYYHGFLPKTQVKQILKKNGDFLLKKHIRSSDTATTLLLTVRTSRKKFDNFYIILNRNTRTVFFEDHEENSVKALIDWHVITKTPLRKSKDARLVRPIERPAWLLNHSSITTIRKLGEAYFGEIYLAEYEGPNGTQQVTIETLRDMSDRRDFMDMTSLMLKNNRKNEIKIVGICIDAEPLMFVLEVSPNVSLEDHLLKFRGIYRYLEEIRRPDKRTLLKQGVRRYWHFAKWIMRPDLFQ